jgi:hypothetical protein
MSMKRTRWIIGYPASALVAVAVAGFAGLVISAGLIMEGPIRPAFESRRTAVPQRRRPANWSEFATHESRPDGRLWCLRA